MELAHLYREIVETSTDAIWVFDLDGRLLYVNPACAELMGVPVEQAAERTAFDFLDRVGRLQFAHHLQEMRGGLFNDSDFEVQFVQDDGSLVWVLASETPLYDDSGELTGVLHRMADYTDRRHTVDELSASQERLAEAQRIARIGSFSWDVTHDVVTGSDGLFLMLDLGEPGRLSHGEFLSLVHERDRGTLDEDLATAIATGTDVRFVARARGIEGWIWVRVQAECTLGEDGQVVAVAGTVQDITETLEAELALKDQVAQNVLMEAVARAANKASTMADVLRDARTLILLHDSWERARGFNCEGGEVTPLYVDDADHAADVLDPGSLALDLALAKRCLAAGAPVWDETGLTLACPVLHAGEVRAIYTITSQPPIIRRRMIEQMAEQAAVQIGRVAEREATARVLAEARDAAEEASRQKSDFLAMISHEIRTPLNGVLGLNDLLMRSGLDAEQRRLVSGVELSGRALLSLINEILDYSKIEAGHLELEAIDFDVRSVLDSAVTPLLSTGRSKGLYVENTYDDAVPAVVNGDPTRLSQVLSNFVSNAVKFTREGAVVVHVSAMETDDGWMLRADVRDTGVGTDVDAETLFAPFQQADTSTTRVFGGTGLGLAISREIVQAVGGEIGFDSQRGVGTHVWFTAFLCPPAGGPVLGAAKPAGGVAALPLIDGERRRVLVVEDNPVNQMVAVGLLEALGYAAETADDGLAAIKLYDPLRHDLILMDVQMPRMDGLAATRELRVRFDDGPRVPVIAMTAAAVPGERERCLEAGMDDFLTKPVDPEALAQTLKIWLDATRPVGSPDDVEPGVQAESRIVDGIDLGRLDMLRDMDSAGTSYLDRAIGNFVAGADDQLAALRSAVDSEDADALRFSAHRLAGSAGNLGLVAAREAVSALELLADSGSTGGAASLLPRAEREVTRGRDALLDYQATHRRADDDVAPLGSAPSGR
ncbi:response regulator [Nocardioides sp. LHG3406-4]|uniref:response regulator n=1 Tax=Nocardioides sp. LHG3406-4 TaxID=2804575 RepID=UPI003CF5C329